MSHFSASWSGNVCRGVTLALVFGGSLLGAQDTGRVLESRLELPDAPGRAPTPAFVEPQAAAPAGLVKGTATVTGTVLDISGAAVAHGRVTLIDGKTDAELGVQESGDHGEFVFTELPAGLFRVIVTAPGLETFVSGDIVLKVDERHVLPEVSLPVAASNSSVQVTVTQEQLAEEQVKAAIKQRVLGVLPNFYTSYIWHAAPLKPKQKFELALRSMTDPVEFGVVAVVAGIEQERDTFPKYGRGAQGYGKRYGAAYADVVTGRIIGSAILPSLFHQDPRYFYRGSGSVPSRGWYAFRSAFVCRNDQERWQPNYSRLLGSFASGGISYLYHPEGDRGPSLIVRNGFIGIGGTVVTNLIREFVSRKLTPNVPGYAKGKPESN